MLIQIPDKSKKALVQITLSSINYGDLPIPEIELVEYSFVLIIKEIPGEQYKDLISEALKKAGVIHFL